MPPSVDTTIGSVPASLILSITWLCVENVLEIFGVVIGDYFVADVEPMLQTPPLVIDAEDDHEGRGFSEMRTLSVPR